MVKEAEEYRAEDEKKRERIEARNKAESMVHQAEKTMEELGDKVSDEQKSSITDKIAALRSAIEEEDHDAIESKMEALESELHSVAEQAYQASAGGAGGPQDPAAGAAPGAGAAAAAAAAAQHEGAEGEGDDGDDDDDDVIDAEFEEAN